VRALAADEQTVKALQSQAFFKSYNEATRAVAKDGEVTVTPLELVADTAA
jgi:hypothetical protein